jgi:uncharacterized membrane protein YgdD (TMEM256/DUF423 family)
MNMSGDDQGKSRMEQTCPAVWRSVGCLFSGAGMIASALAAHLHESVFAEGGRAMLRTASEVMAWHGLALLALGLASYRFSRLAQLAITAFIPGVLLFVSGVLITALSGIHPGPIAPSGGSLLIMAWLVLAGALFRR